MTRQNDSGIPGFDPDGGYYLGGVRVVDHWLSLEDPAAEAHTWFRALSKRSEERLSSWPHLRQVEADLLLMRDQPARAGEMETAHGYLSLEDEGLDRPARILVAGVEREFCAVYDPSEALDPDGHPRRVLWVELSPDRSMLAFGVCSDGSELAQIEILDIARRQVVPHIDLPPMHSAANRAQWLPDSSSLTFVGLAGEPRAFDNQVFTYHLSSDSLTLEPVPWRAPDNFRAVHIAADGRHAVASEGYTASVPSAIAERAGNRWTWTPFVHAIGEATFGHLVADRYVCITYVGADRGRVVSIPTNDGDPNDPGSWQELVAESSGVLASLAIVAGRLFIHQFERGRSAVKVCDADGAFQYDLHLPFSGTASTGAVPLYAMDSPPADTFQVSLSNLNQTSMIVSSSPGDLGQVSVQRGSERRFDDLELSHELIPVSDGAEILLSRMAKRGVHGTSHPTLIYAYGGFNRLVSGSYDPVLAAFAEYGGEVVLGHISGDGDLGKAIWQRGRLDRKQKCYDDIYTIAEHLIASGSTRPDLLALAGISNGGLMSAVAATQRPELWRAVVCLAGWVDPLGSARFPFLDICARMELGDLGDPDVVERVLDISPIHLVSSDASYPAMYFDAGERDTRVPAYMPKKLVAELSRLTDAELEFRIWERAGHGHFDDALTSLQRQSRWLSFVMRELGMTPTSA